MDFGAVEAERSQIDDTPDSPRRRQPEQQPVCRAQRKA